jgi:putative redox protein
MNNILVSASSGKLSGVLHPSGALNNGLTVVMCHGFRGSKDGGGRAVKLAERIADLGLNVIRFDFTPYSNLTCQVREIADVVRYVRSNLSNGIILLGRSMGGSAALAYAAGKPDLAALCLWAAPWNLKETFRLALGEHYDQLAAGTSVTLQDEYGCATLSPDLIKDFDCFDLLADVRRISHLPLLQVHGTADSIVPVCQAEEIHRVADGKKKLVLIEGGDHQFLQHAEQASEAVISWLKTVI